MLLRRSVLFVVCGVLSLFGGCRSSLLVVCRSLVVCSCSWLVFLTDVSWCLLSLVLVVGGSCLLLLVVVCCSSWCVVCCWLLDVCCVLLCLVWSCCGVLSLVVWNCVLFAVSCDVFSCVLCFLPLFVVMFRSLCVVCGLLLFVVVWCCSL